ncbi:MAG: FHA domain-containing protein [Candidatus Sedimenticola sp. PURPLELP]
MAKLTLFYKSRAMDVHRLGEGETVIGRSSECDLQIDSPAIAYEHALIWSDGPSFKVRPAQSDTEVLVNNRLVKEHTLTHGDLIKVGKHVLGFSKSAITIDFPKSPAHPSISPHEELPADPPNLERIVNSIDTLPNGCIQVLNGEHLGKILRLQRSLMRLGIKGDECAVIAHRSDGYYLSHLEGEKPPLINGTSIGEHSVKLHEGCIIELGKITMRFHENAITQAAAS